MRTFINSILAGIAIIMVFGCENDKVNEDKPLVTSGKIINASDCKSSRSDTIVSSNSSCAEYTYSSVANRLLIKHINAGFNCCPDSINCIVTVVNDTIKIQEFENSALCNCGCLYDLNIEVTGVAAQSYHIQFIEEYCGDQEQLVFDVDFSMQQEGLYCVPRTHYPWGF